MMLDDAVFKDNLARASIDTKFFAKMFLPNHFDLPFSSLHDKIYSLIDDESNKKVAIAAPRGFGKSTGVGLAYPLRNILFQKKKYIIIVGASAEAAIEHAENMKKEITDNELIQKVFGDLQSTSFSKDMWELSSGIRVLPRGPGQKVRGRKFRWYRPDLIIFDDLENDENVMNELQRDKLASWVNKSVLNSVDRGRKNWHIRIIGTILHHDSYLNNLMSDRTEAQEGEGRTNIVSNIGWESIRLQIASDDLKHSNWPDQISDKEVEELVDEHRRKGKLDEFYMEYMNIPINLEDQAFKQEYIQYYNDFMTEKDFEKMPNLQSVILADPAKTHKKGSADTAVVGVSIDFDTDIWYVRDIVAGKLFRHEMEDTMLSMADRIGAKVLAPEVTSLNEYLTHYLKQKIYDSNKFYELVELSPRQSKVDRAAALQPYFRRGSIFLNRTCSTQLERQLLEFPKCSKWDIIDCLAHVIQAKEVCQKYATIKDDFEDIEKEFEELDPPEFDEPVSYDWMNC